MNSEHVKHQTIMEYLQEIYPTLALIAKWSQTMNMQSICVKLELSFNLTQVGI